MKKNELTYVLRLKELEITLQRNLIIHLLFYSFVMLSKKVF